MDDACERDMLTRVTRHGKLHTESSNWRATLRLNEITREDAGMPVGHAARPPYRSTQIEGVYRYTN